MLYKKTADSNIFLQEQTIQRNIRKDKIESQVLELQRRINSFPAEKTQPDKETLDLWNETFANQIEKDGLQQELIGLQNILTELGKAI
jgi:hypothetical protein